jgi:hypothetical protein
MSSMSTGPGDQVNVNEDYYREDRPSVWRWLLPLLALAVVAALLWAMFGNRGATYPTTGTGNGSAISTPAGGSYGSTGSGGTGSTTGTGSTGAGVTGAGGTTSGSPGSTTSGAGTSGATGSGATGGTTSGGTTGSTTTKP